MWGVEIGEHPACNWSYKKRIGVVVGYVLYSARPSADILTIAGRSVVHQIGSTSSSFSAWPKEYLSPIHCYYYWLSLIFWSNCFGYVVNSAAVADSKSVAVASASLTATPVVFRLLSCTCFHQQSVTRLGCLFCGCLYDFWWEETW